ncbi:hypothetical protein DMB66_50620 [Actinoplanes sp. ATCC 53533]|uniref:NAD-dependent epimerase/dehydratase family protein n=1 Tax=Actinoplanes sp. ATCC 53533 TaxID=1288362 RepID=UPI000F76D6B7|nr:NAD-dependent epimerase/dehydratase family protein [Actinoplanes sp. ATCC 53533]RSM45687.1 hypothetical protein DMB66_50620 [Actinoplanes sp. ATCC 53533]
MTTVLVTGAAGFIGRHLALACRSRGWSTTAVDLRPMCLEDIETLESDARSDKLLARIGRGEFDAVLHQAAIADTLENRRSVLHGANVELPLALAGACARSGTRFVFASSSSVYGAVGRREPVPETAVGDADWCTGPLNEYARSKLLLEARMGQLGGDLPWVGLRYTNVFGAGEQHKGPMASIMSQILRQAAVFQPVTLFGDALTASRDYLPVSVLVDTVTRLATTGAPAGIYNLGAGHAVSFAEVLQWCAAFLEGRTLDARLVPNAVAGRYQRWTCADMSRLRAALPGAPEIGVDQVRDAAHLLFRSFQPVAVSG